MAARRLALKHLVVFVPGIGGSELRDDKGTVRWGGSLLRFAASVLLPDELALGANAHLTPTGLLSVAADLPGLTNVHPYDKFLRLMRREFSDVRVDDGHPDRRDLNANVVAFPYDFRRSLVEAAERLATEVKERREHLGDPDVIVVGHSMGGLVARYWMGPLGGWAVCKGLITLGTPHRGAPKAADWLVNGVSILGIGLDRATRVIRTWPSVYELLPRYKAVNAWTGEGWKPTYPHEIAFAHWDGREASNAFAMHSDIEKAWQTVAPSQGAGGPEVSVFYGDGHATTRSLRFRDGVLSASEDAPYWLPATAFSGDGTVPQLSAIPIELSDANAGWQAAGEKHGAIGSIAAAVTKVKEMNAASTSAVRGEAEGRVSVGTALPETVWSGVPHVARASLVGEFGEVETVAWTAAVWRADDPVERSIEGIECLGNGERCEVMLPGLDPGQYRISIAARLGLPVEPHPVDEYLMAVAP